MNEAFVRQRRNLLISSIIIFLISFAGIELDKITLLGSEFKISDPIMIYIFLWLMQIYFFLRYIPFYVELDENHKDYGFYKYPWGGFYEVYFEKNVSIKSVIIIIWLTLVFLFQNIIGIFGFLFHTIFYKNFTENIFPILFAIFVFTSSFYAPFTKEKLPLAHDKINQLNNVIKEETYGQILTYCNDEINQYKESLNSYYRYFTNRDLFEIEQSVKESSLKFYMNLENIP